MFTATHIPTGRAVEIQDVMTNEDGEDIFYCEDHMRPTIAGWHTADRLEFHN